MYNGQQRDLSEDKTKEVAWISLGVCVRLEAGQHRKYMGLCGSNEMLKSGRWA